ncbi:MAG TPA: ABC transporter, partial [Cyanobacteria bacterium UBA11149]|nr:ABC transporter [Cyanobacteria bacterium UBA11149]
NNTPIGFIFNLGTAIGFFVGLVIFYQILYNDISERLPEYATLKAIGYGHAYLLAVVFQQALILAVLGYIPGFAISLGLYNLTINATNLPLFMTLEKATFVLALTVLMCSIAGAIAMKKIGDSDPVDLLF